MTISVIIPVFKVEKYIHRCLESVIAQECNVFDIECILVDDCSPDRSMAIAKEVINHYNGSIIFQILSNSDNQGVSCSRNNGLKIAKGDYVLFLDSDDTLTKDCLQQLYKEIKHNGCVVDMVMGNSYDYHTGVYWLDRDREPYLLLDHHDIMRRFLQVDLPSMAWNKLIRRQFLLDNSLFFRPQMLHEDELWSYDLYNVISSIVLIPNVTYYYRQNADSIMNSASNLIRRSEGYHILISKMLDSLCHDLYVDRFFWGIYMYMNSDTVIRDGGLTGEIVLKNKQLRKIMLYRSLRDCRLSISSFMLLTVFPPFRWLIRFKWFRQKYYWLKKLFEKFAQLFDIFHHC